MLRDRLRQGIAGAFCGLALLAGLGSPGSALPTPQVAVIDLRIISAEHAAQLLRPLFPHARIRMTSRGEALLMLQVVLAYVFFACFTAALAFNFGWMAARRERTPIRLLTSLGLAVPGAVFVAAAFAHSFGLAFAGLLLIGIVEIALSWLPPADP